jgi:ketosteroid isomerase-like protein
MASEKQTATSGDVSEAFRGYTEVFQALDARAVARFFHEPALMITPEGVFALPDASAVEQVYRHVMAALPARGYSKTEFSQIVERRLGADLAVVSGGGVWKKASGEDLQQPFGMTYTLRRVQGVWRIAVAAIHEPA